MKAGASSGALQTLRAVRTASESRSVWSAFRLAGALGLGARRVQKRVALGEDTRAPENMSIATKTGDGGTTALMYNRRVPKNHPRIEACGAMDELNAAVGFARASATEEFVRNKLLPVQTDLITIMGELATLSEDLPRYVKDGFSRVTPEMVTKLDETVVFIESKKVSFKGWATPGANISSAALDMARTVCRRAERRVYELPEQVENPSILVYLNRLSDALWLLARWAENLEN